MILPEVSGVYSRISQARSKKAYKWKYCGSPSENVIISRGLLGLKQGVMEVQFQVLFFGE